MTTWIGPVYKRLAGSELGEMSHTSGIVPTKSTENFFGEPLVQKSHKIKTIVIELSSGETSEIIKTNVNYFFSKTHRHIHLTGSLMPSYKKMGAKEGDILLFWKSLDDPNMFKAELIKQNTARWGVLNHYFKSKGGQFFLAPPGIILSVQEDEEKYQEESPVDETLHDKDFPPVIKSSRKSTRLRILPPRSKAKGDYVLKKNEYKCEVDQNHKTFLTKSGNNYMEKHHLIPMEFYDRFEYSLDDISNIVSICPMCHRLIHHGRKNDSEKLVEILWNLRKDKLKASNIGIELEELKKMYSG